MLVITHATDVCWFHRFQMVELDHLLVNVLWANMKSSVATRHPSPLDSSRGDLTRAHMSLIRQSGRWTSKTNNDINLALEPFRRSTSTFDFWLQKQSKHLDRGAQLRSMWTDWFVRFYQYDVQQVAYRWWFRIRMEQLRWSDMFLWFFNSALHANVPVD